MRSHVTAAAISVVLLASCARTALRVMPPTASPEALPGSPAGVQPSAQPPAPPDAELVRGMDLYKSGDYDQAVLLLDTVARRLAGSGRSQDLAQAYFFMGAANLGQGQEVQARARFRDALAADVSLRPSPYEFSPSILNVFEAVREQFPVSAPSVSQPSLAAATPVPGVQIYLADRSGRARGYPFTPGMTVRQLIELAGMTAADAVRSSRAKSAQQFLVLRNIQGREKRIKLPLDSADLMAGDTLLVSARLY
jgi:hypothetical protein